jgi:hypothetical protein
VVKDSKAAAFWVAVPCSPVEVTNISEALKMEAAQTSETSVNFHQTTRSCNPEDSRLRNDRRENHKSHLPAAAGNTGLKFG